MIMMFAQPNIYGKYSSFDVISTNVLLSKISVKILYIILVKGYVSSTYKLYFKFGELLFSNLIKGIPKMCFCNAKKR